MRLKDRVAIVTGAAGGLGKMFALELAREGAQVAVVDVHDAEPVQKEIEAGGGKAIALFGDVTDPESMNAMAAQTRNYFGKIDILINNAAIYAGLTRGSFMDIDLEEWDRVMAVNVKGAFLAVRAVYPHMKAQHYGKVINIASEVFFTGSHGFAHYVTSKGGIIGLTRALAIETGSDNICINAIAPGFTDTEASRGIADVHRYDTSKTPLQRLCQPEDLKGTAIYLASSDSDFITGQVIIVDGGRVMH
jgi:NAD(P)-dependent dehydrogenase (short-subunit alcohol dehydrogenase family)